MSKRVLVTGVSGFIAKHVAQQLLQKGYDVRGTIRTLQKAQAVERSLKDAGCDTSKLSFCAADLTADEGWPEAVAGCDAIIHLASPLPTQQPRDRNALVPAARDGALRVLRASGNAERIVMTSSVAAMMYRAGRSEVFPFSEDDWTDPDWKELSAYIVSKTVAERAAWDTAVVGGFKHRLTTINPGLVLGPPLDDDTGASLDVVRLFLKGAYPALPPAAFPIVDVRDVAALHIKAMELPETGGRRLIAAAETLSLSEVAGILREAFPAYEKKIPGKVLPAWLIRIAALFDRSLASVTPDLGVRPQPQTDYVTALTGLAMRPAREAIVSAGEALIRLKMI